MNAKAKGSRRERQTIALLESLGYVCTKTAGSLGIWDVVAIGPADFIVVQVKSNRWPDRAEMEALRAFPCPPNCRKLIHRWRDRRSTPDVREF